MVPGGVHQDRAEVDTEIGLFGVGERVHGIEDDIDAEFGIVFSEEPLVAEIIIPFAAIVFVAIEHSHAAIDSNGLQVVVDEVVAPTVELEAGIGRPFFKVEEAAVEGVVICELLQGLRAEEGGHLGFEGTGEKAIDVVVAVVREDEASVLNKLVKIGALPGVELYEFVAADIGEGIPEDVGVVEVDDHFTEVDGEGSIFYQGIEEVGGHPLVGIPVS